MVTRHRARLLVFALALALLGTARAAAAQAPLERAKELFREGNELRKAGDCARALALYLESRGLVPSVANTTNAAICMAQLGRNDEALELYEELLIKFRAELSDEEGGALARAMADLRRRVGRLEVSSNVQGLLVVDGRSRGQLPLVSPIPIVPGAHVVRVIKDGYETFEQSVSVEVGATLTVDAKLSSLAHAGRLRLPAVGGDEGADVVVDGAVIGKTPWEGTLTPGPHLLIVRKGRRGAGPQLVVVVENQTVTTEVTLSALGSELRVVPAPLSARVSIDGVTVGEGEWRGMLPIGRHSIEVREEAYLPLVLTVDVTLASMGVLSPRLEPDPAHPRWARRSGRLWVEAFAALGVGAGLGSGAEASCERVACSARRAALGGFSGARLGYELPSGLSVHVGLGYLALRTTLARRLEAAFASTAPGGTTQVPTTYDVEDTVDFSGPFASAGLGYQLPLGKTFEIGVRTELGIVLASARDAMRGTITAGGRTLDLGIQGSGSASHGAAPFVLPELFARARRGRFYGGVGIAAGIFFVRGPSLETGDAAPLGFDCGKHPGAADCAPGSGLLRGERAFGPALAWLPGVELGATF